MGRDPIGGKAVNLMKGPRQDIYQEVADKVTAAVREDCVAVSPQEAACPCHAWSGKVTRKTVKRGVMTTPYGVTPEGIRRQLIDDGLLDDVPGDMLQNATYMRDRMVTAIDDTIVEGKAIMRWMQNVAKKLCEENKPVVWTTPIGLVCKQEYRKPSQRRVTTLVGRTKVLEPNPTGELRKSKQFNSIAPNIVHSFDAAHLMMTVNAAADCGISVGTVHDSYGTHACDVDTLGSILRDMFIEIYSQDQLANLVRDFTHCAGRFEEEWMTPPDQ
jgi:DNA-directed RNA polymerase